MNTTICEEITYGEIQPRGSFFALCMHRLGCRTQGGRSPVTVLGVKVVSTSKYNSEAQPNASSGTAPFYFEAADLRFSAS